MWYFCGTNWKSLYSTDIQCFPGTLVIPLIKHCKSFTFRLLSLPSLVYTPTKGFHGWWYFTLTLHCRTFISRPNWGSQVELPRGKHQWICSMWRRENIVALMNSHNPLPSLKTFHCWIVAALCLQTTNRYWGMASQTGHWYGLGYGLS